jgi:alanyl-tRNA synthetase
VKAAEIRSTFLQFFASKGHTIVPSSPVVPGDDPTLLFTNAGMNQFGRLLGFDRRPYVRAATSRNASAPAASTTRPRERRLPARHHLLRNVGQFSFGDYFKKDALRFAWELLTEVYKLPGQALGDGLRRAGARHLEERDRPADRTIVRIGDNKGARFTSDNF